MDRQLQLCVSKLFDECGSGDWRDGDSRAKRLDTYGGWVSAVRVM